MDQERKPYDGSESESSSNDNTQFTSAPPAPGPDFYNPQFAPEPPKKHSGIGISSFVIAMVAVLSFIIAIILFAVATSQITNGGEDFAYELEEWAESYTAGDQLDPAMFDNAEFSGFIGSIIGAVVLIFGAVVIAFIGLILGLIGAFSKTRKRLFGIIGSVLNGLIVLGAIGFFIIGIAAMFAAV